MDHTHRLRGEKVTLEPFRVEDVTERYLGWLCNPDVVGFTEIEPEAQTLETARDYVKANLRDPNAALWRIEEMGYGHIGNIRLSAISRRHRRGMVAILIGDHSRWGRGLAVDAIQTLCRHAFEDLGLHKLSARILAVHHASCRAFEKSGFAAEALLKDQAWFRGRFVDVVEMALFQPLPGCQNASR